MLYRTADTKVMFPLSSVWRLLNIGGVSGWSEARLYQLSKVRMSDAVWCKCPLFVPFCSLCVSGISASRGKRRKLFRKSQSFVAIALFHFHLFDLIEIWFHYKELAKQKRVDFQQENCKIGHFHTNFPLIQEILKRCPNCISACVIPM